jgi:hypothetical protein
MHRNQLVLLTLSVSLLPVKTTSDALTTTTMSPHATLGEYVGLCLPVNTGAICAASRPTTWPRASIKCHIGRWLLRNTALATDILVSSVAARAICGRCALFDFSASLRMLRKVLTAALLLICCTLSSAFAPPVHSAALCLKQFHTHTAKPAAQQRKLHALQAKTPEEEAEDDRWAKNPYGWTTGPTARRNGLVVQVLSAQIEVPLLHGRMIRLLLIDTSIGILWHS